MIRTDSLELLQDSQRRIAKREGVRGKIDMIHSSKSRSRMQVMKITAGFECLENKQTIPGTNLFVLERGSKSDIDVSNDDRRIVDRNQFPWDFRRWEMWGKVDPSSRDRAPKAGKAQSDREFRGTGRGNERPDVRWDHKEEATKLVTCGATMEERRWDERKRMSEDPVEARHEPSFSDEEDIKGWGERGSRRGGSRNRRDQVNKFVLWQAINIHVADP
jgi:hypothetical protein